MACIEDMIAMSKIPMESGKRAAGRPKDLAQAAELETIQRLLAEEGGRAD